MEETKLIKEIMELSKKAEEELKTGDEPRKYKKCRRCNKKPCECITKVDGKSLGILR